MILPVLTFTKLINVKTFCVNCYKISLTCDKNVKIVAEIQ
jgi:CO dehydrogenase/acetyl-CoA synthase alpha subunit